LHVHQVETAITLIEGEGRLTLDDQPIDIKASMTILAPAGKNYMITTGHNPVKKKLPIALDLVHVEYEKLPALFDAKKR
jgi:quercetin dioxygenase-like cupin family protein